MGTIVPQGLACFAYSTMKSREGWRAGRSRARFVCWRRSNPNYPLGYWRRPEESETGFRRYVVFGTKDTSRNAMKTDYFWYLGPARRRHQSCPGLIASGPSRTKSRRRVLLQHPGLSRKAAVIGGFRTRNRGKPHRCLPSTLPPTRPRTIARSGCSTCRNLRPREALRLRISAEGKSFPSEKIPRSSNGGKIKSRGPCGRSKARRMKASGFLLSVATASPGHTPESKSGGKAFGRKIPHQIPRDSAAARTLARYSSYPAKIAHEMRFSSFEEPPDDRPRNDEHGRDQSETMSRAPAASRGNSGVHAAYIGWRTIA